MIKNRQHTRDRSKGIQAYKETIIRQFDDQEKAQKFISEVAESHPRYVRDQLQVIQSVITHFRSTIEKALAVCMEKQLWSANDLRDIALHFTRLNEEKTSRYQSTNDSKNDNPAAKATVVTRGVEYYTSSMGGVS